MSPLLRVRLLIAAVGVALWGYGLNQGNDRVRIGGMALMAVSLVLRWLNPFRRREGQTPKVD